MSMDSSPNTLATLVARKALEAPGQPAIFYGDRCISYGTLVEEGEQAARALLAIGVRNGDRVGALLGNEPDWVVMALAASMVGAAFVPLNTWYKVTELSWTIHHCGLVAVVVAPSFLKADYAALFSEMIPELAERRSGELRSAAFPALRTVIFKGVGPSGAVSWGDFLRQGETVGASDLHEVRSAVSPDSNAYVLYTSGSTAEPKGVLLNHRGIVENGFDLGARRGIVADDRVWIGTPLFYGLGATNALPAAFTHGASIVLQDHFEAGRAIEVVRRSGATVYYGTGNMTRAILDHPDYSLGKIGTLKKGNAGTMPEYKRLTLVEMGISGAVPAYGLTESYGNATVGEPDDPLEVKLATNGRPLPGMEMRIVDQVTREPVAQGETGLVLIRGHTTVGYLDNPVETAKALLPDGFFDTGDLGSFDREGRFIFHSRLKEVLKSGGINISPVEVEQLIASHSDVRDAFVVGISDPVKGDRVVAFVDAVAPLSEQAVRDHVKARAASFKVPHHVLFRSETELPRLASGKIAKHLLADEAREELGL